MTKACDDGKDATACQVVFVDTNLHTNIAIPVFSAETIFDLKLRILTEHTKCFPNFGEIYIHTLKVKRKGKLYSLSDLVPARSVFPSSANDWFLFADITSQFVRYDAFNHPTELLPGTSLASLEKNKSKKNIKIAADIPLNGNAAMETRPVGKASVSQKLVILKSTDQNVGHSDDGVEKAGQNKLEQSVGQHSEGNKVLQFHDRDVEDVTTGGDKTKGIIKKKNRRMEEAGVTNDETYADTDASVGVSARSHATTVDVIKGSSPKDVDRDIVKLQCKGDDISELYQSTYPEKSIVSDSEMPENRDVLQLVGIKNTSIHVHCNKSNISNPNNLDEEETGTEELGKPDNVADARDNDKEPTTFGLSLESGMKRSKKRKNRDDDVSRQRDIKSNYGSGEPDIGDMERGTEVPELGMTIPLKRKKTGAVISDVVKMDRVRDEKAGMPEIKQQSHTKSSKNKIKQKQTPVVTNISEFPVTDESNNVETEKNKSTWSKTEAEKDDNTESLSSDNAALVVISEANIEISTTEVGMDEVLTKNNESDVKPQEGDVETIHNDAEPVQLTQKQKSVEGAEVMIKRSSKRTKKNQNLVVKKITEYSVEDQNNNIKRDRSISACTESTTEKNDEIEFLSSCHEQIDKADSVADTDFAIETRNAEGRVDDEVFVTNHGSDVSSQKEAHETMQRDVEPKQLTQIQKSEEDNGSKRKISKKKIKQRQTHLLKSISEIFVEEQNNSIEVKRSKSTRSRSEVEKVEMKSLSSPAEQNANVSLIPASEPDVEISIKAQVHEVINTNQGSDLGLQQEVVDACQNNVEPIQPTQVQTSRLDTNNNSVQTKKKSKKHHTETGNSNPNVVDGDGDDTRHHIACARMVNRNDSRTSSSQSDMLNKRSHQGEAKRELRKMKQHLSNLRESNGKFVQIPSGKKCSMLKCSSIFKDESSSSSEDKSGGDDSDSSTEAPHGDHASSSDFSEDESRGSWASPKHGNSETGGSTLNSKLKQNNLTLESVLRSSQKYKKAKMVASQLQLEEDESQPTEVAPVSQVKK